VAGDIDRAWAPSPAQRGRDEASLLLHAPEDGDRWEWVEVCNGADAVPLAERDVGDDLRVEYLRLGRDPLLLCRIGRARIWGEK